MDQQWDIDLMHMTKIAKYNDGYYHILLAIDIFSCYVWMVLYRDESGNKVTLGLQIYSSIEYHKLCVQTKAKEFL